MALRLALQITGDGAGAKKAVDDTTASIDKLGEASETASRRSAQSARDMGAAFGATLKQFEMGQQLARSYGKAGAAAQGAVGNATRLSAQSARDMGAAFGASLKQYEMGQQLARSYGQAGAAAQGAVGNSIKLSNFQLMNMQMQMQDIGVMLASGQSPFVLMMQQGSQIVQMFGPGTGVLAALRAVGTGLVTFVTNPLNLALLGFAALSGLAGLAFRAVTGGAEEADDALERHEALIGRIKQAWPEAAKGVRGYARETKAVMAAELEAVAKDLRTKLAESTRAALGEMVAGMGLRGGRFGVEDDLKPVVAAVRALSAAASAGVPDVARLRQEIVELAAAQPANAALQELRDKILAATEEALSFEQALNQNAAAIGALGAEARRTIPQLAAFADAMKTLEGLALPDLSEREQALTAYQAALNNALTRGQATVAEEQYAAVLGRVAAAEKKAADEKVARLTATAGNRAAAEAERERQAVQGLIGALSEEYALMGVSARERATQNALRQAGAAATATEREEIRGLVEATYDLNESQDRARERMAALHGVAQGMVGAFRQARESGKGFFESVAASVDTLNKRLQDLAINGVLDALTGAAGAKGSQPRGGGFLSGLIGSVFGGGLSAAARGLGGAGLFAGGGFTGAGGRLEPAGIVHRGEFVVNAPATERFRPLLESINAGHTRGFAAGGYAGPVGVPSSGRGSGWGAPVNIEFKPQIIPPPGYQTLIDDVPDGRGGRNPRIMFEEIVAAAGGSRRVRGELGLRPRLKRR